MRSRRLRLVPPRPSQTRPRARSEREVRLERALRLARNALQHERDTERNVLAVIDSALRPEDR